MNPARRATLSSSRGSRHGTNEALPTMVEIEVIGWSGVRKKPGGDDLERRADPITARTAARLVA